jgi:hypothetical protein
MKKTGAILLMMLFAAMVFASTPVVVPKKPCSCPKAVLHTKCAMDSVTKSSHPAVAKKAEVQAKKDVKDESKSIFSALFSFKFPILPLEDFFLSAQKALIEKIF